MTGDLLSVLADGIRSAVAWIFTSLTTWWLKLPSPDLAHEAAIGSMRQWLLPITAAVAITGMITSAARMVLTRRPNPLLDVGSGLVVIAAAGTLGVLVPSLLMQAGDSWSGWVLQKASDGSLSSRMSSLENLTGVPDVIVIVYGIFALVMGTIQAALLMFRQAAVVILAAVLPLAAAGAMSPLTRNWVRKIVSWMLALIMYKPAAAAVYATAFTMIGKGTNLQTIVMGFAMLALSLLAMPVLMRFFTWTTGAIASGGGAGQFLGMAAAGAFAAGAMRSPAAGSGASASEHASYLTSAQSSPAGTAGGANSTPPPSQSAPPSPAVPTAATPPASQPSAPDAKAGAGTGAAGAGSLAGGSTSDRPASSATAGAASAGTATAATAGLAGAATAAVLAGQGLASGARDTAATVTEEGDKR